MSHQQNDKNTRAGARGRWAAIFTELQVPEELLSGAHGPCPKCGGTDRFRYTNYQNNGDYFCNGCGPGDGFDIIQAVKSCDFKTAAGLVDEVLKTNPQQSDVFDEGEDLKKRKRLLNKVWAQARDKAIYTSYLQSRGIRLHALPPGWDRDIRGHAYLYMKTGNTGKRVHGMLGLIRNRHGAPISIHRTYIQDKVKKVMPPMETIVGGGIRLGDVMKSKMLVVGEGIETTLSAMARYSTIPGIATISALGMEKLSVPSHIDALLIVADNDKSFTGQRAAFSLAYRYRDLSRVTVLMPGESGHDYNDFIRDSSGSLMVFSNGRKE